MFVMVFESSLRHHFLEMSFAIELQNGKLRLNYFGTLFLRLGIYHLLDVWLNAVGMSQHQTALPLK